MNWTAPVDIYCERLGPGLLAEPLNAVTNAAFLVAAWLAWRAAKARGRLDWPMWTLIGLTAAIGVGSTLFHTFAQRWAGAADVIPILLFIVTYFGLSIWRFFGARAAEAVALAAGFLFFATGLRAAAGGALPDALQPAVGYLPALVALGMCGALLLARRHRVGWRLLGATALFTASLTFRSLDMAVCEGFPTGTHFMWHILNGCVLGTLLFAWIGHGAAPVAKQAPAG
ncbi:hypothetical protein [Rubrimonas cliftonensis]|uniref:Ceramidase n=1 Tax=Rubrimonas cliftonensis TaxID=89524 RepID=A0A1H3YD77_9RHOB|nr:hypothetical protein [Rubrimonas cliftonensis]SEA08848.1 Ceramidase [Rubrimonas cliftonensis]